MSLFGICIWKMVERLYKSRWIFYILLLKSTILVHKDPFQYCHEWNTHAFQGVLQLIYDPGNKIKRYKYEGW